jgi:hypothetical protein
MNEEEHQTGAHQQNKNNNKPAEGLHGTRDFMGPKLIEKLFLQGILACNFLHPAVKSPRWPVLPLRPNLQPRSSNELPHRT